MGRVTNVFQTVEYAGLISSDVNFWVEKGWVIRYLELAHVTLGVITGQTATPRTVGKFAILEILDAMKQQKHHVVQLNLSYLQVEMQGRVLLQLTKGIDLCQQWHYLDYNLCGGKYPTKVFCAKTC